MRLALKLILLLVWISTFRFSLKSATQVPDRAINKKGLCWVFIREFFKKEVIKKDAKTVWNQSKIIRSKMTCKWRIRNKCILAPDITGFLSNKIVTIYPNILERKSIANGSVLIMIWSKKNQLDHRQKSCSDAFCHKEN